MGTRPFHCRQFVVHQDRCAMKVGTDSLLLGSWVAVESANRLLDVGTGTGILALMMAQRIPHGYIDGVELDVTAAEQAADNFQLSPWGDRIKVYPQSFQSFIERCTHQYDLIISNPPFYVAGSGASSPIKRRQLARHTDQLDHKTLLCGVERLLRSDGRFALILPYDVGQHFVLQAEAYGLKLSRLCEVRPFPERQANRLLIELSKVKRQHGSEILAIRSDQQTYSAAYRELTAEFYL